MKHFKYVKYIVPTDRYIKQIPKYSAFGRRTILRINPDKLPDLHWSFGDTYHTTNIRQIDSNATLVSTNYINADTLSYTGGDTYGEWCGTTLNTIGLSYKVIGSPLSAMLSVMMKTTMKSN